jgi:hypothetical protein
VLQLTMQAALDGSVPHDVTVRSREDGRERRLLMRVAAPALDRGVGLARAQRMGGGGAHRPFEGVVDLASRCRPPSTAACPTTSRCAAARTAASGGC